MAPEEDSVGIVRCQTVGDPAEEQVQPPGGRSKRVPALPVAACSCLIWINDRLRPVSSLCRRDRKDDVPRTAAGQGGSNGQPGIQPARKVERTPPLGADLTSATWPASLAIRQLLPYAAPCY